MENTSTELIEDQEKYLGQICGLQSIAALFQRKTGVAFFIKDKDLKIRYANELTLERCRCKTQQDIYGKTDYDFFPKHFAEKYRHDDAAVMETGEPILNMPELAPGTNGLVNCYITNKVPLFNVKGKCVGMAGATTSSEQNHRDLQPFLKILKAVEYINQHYHENISLTKLCEETGMHNRKFAETFHSVFNQPAQGYLISVRVLAASRALIETDMPLSEISDKVGFYDQGVLSRQFSKHMGIPPLKFRKKHRENSRREE